MNLAETVRSIGEAGTCQWGPQSSNTSRKQFCGGRKRQDADKRTQLMGLQRTMAARLTATHNPGLLDVEPMSVWC